LSFQKPGSSLPAIITLSSTEAAAGLLRGLLVALPTETVYGLGANALDETAVAGIFKAKNRPSFDPLIIHQSTAERILKYAAEIPPAAQKLANTCWPGPLTLVLTKKDIVPDLVSAGLKTVALRVPDHPLTREVLDLVDFPVAAPSANPFGFVSPTSAQHVVDQLGDKIDFILDGGPCRVGLESTIVGFPDGVPTVLRKGGLSIETIEEILGQPVAIKTHSSSRPDAPGMLSKHYSPGVKMQVIDTQVADFEYPPNSALITFGSKSASLDHKNTGPDVYDLSPERDVKVAAANLFQVLRTIGKKQYDFVGVVLLPEVGLGRAINDRLRRAAATE
jgi:L-threonylcarbamoyladenylate synthase